MKIKELSELKRHERKYKEIKLKRKFLGQVKFLKGNGMK